jgi:DNA-binding beta-propeller fold protein YncE
VSLPQDIEVSGDGLVVLWTNPGDNTVASRHVVSGRVIPVSLPDGPHKLALVQNESVVNNTSARALSSSTPPALVYVTSSFGNRVYPLDLRTITGLGIHVFDRLHENPDGSATPLVPPIEVEASPQGVAFLQNGAVALVTHRNIGKVSIIETARHRVLQTVPLSGEGAQGPVDLAITPDGDRAYVACELSHTVKALR